MPEYYDDDSSDELPDDEPLNDEAPEWKYKMVRPPLRPIPDTLEEADPDDRDAYIAFLHYTIEQNEHHGFMLNLEKSWRQFSMTWYTFSRADQEKMHREWSEGYAEALRKIHKPKKSSDGWAL